MTATTPTADEARRQQKEAEETAERLRAEIEEKQRQIREAQQAGVRAKLDEKAAEQAERIAERRKKLHKPVSAEIARRVAEDIVRLFKDDDDIDPSEWWEKLEDARCRLHSNEVDEDARSLVLAAELVVGAADHWSEHRATAEFGHRFSRTPRGDHRVQNSVTELQRELAGDPVPQMESMFALFEANVDSQQMAKMLGIVTVDGTGDTEALARFFDRLAERAGIQERRSLAVKKYGALDDADAWQMRAQRIENGTGDWLVPKSADLGQQR
jgi:exonuclease VII large subunit